MATTSIISSDMATFSAEELRRAGELLGVPLDKSSALRALIIQRDTGLSIVRGEVSVVEFRGKKQVFVTKNGYLAYAARQEEYDGFVCNSGTDEDGLYADAEVYHKRLRVPIKVRRYLSEYDQGREPWTSKPRTMIEKVALSQALRLAFPVLNGTYDESEEWDGCQRVTVERRLDDIDVVPAEPPAEPPAAPTVQKTPKPAATKPAKTIQTCTMERAQKYLENFVDRGFSIDIFDRAEISPVEFDEGMICEEFARLNAAEKAAKAAKQPEEIDWKLAIPHGKCDVCGKTVLRPDAKRSLDKYNRIMCPACLKQELQISVAKAKKPKDEPVCSVCGKAVTAGRKNACEFMEQPVTCHDCGPDAKKGGQNE